MVGGCRLSVAEDKGKKLEGASCNGGKEFAMGVGRKGKTLTVSSQKHGLTRQRKLCLNVRRARGSFSWSIAAIVFLSGVTRGMSLLTWNSMTSTSIANHIRGSIRLQSSSEMSPITSYVSPDSILGLEPQSNGIFVNEDEENIHQRHLRFAGIGR